MLGDGRDKYRTKAWVKAHLVIVQYPNGSSVECDTCGLTALTQRELADILGVNLSQLSSFLHRRPIRPDVYQKIVMQVKEIRSA